MLFIGFMSNNFCYIAAAGAGKTTYIIEEAKKAVDNDGTNHVLIITLTIKNQDNITEKIRALPFQIAKRIHVSGWYKFLLRYIIRPYKGDVIPELYDRDVSMLWSEANQTRKIGNRNFFRYASNDKKAKYLKDWKIYKNYLSEFAYECIQANPTTSLCRLNKIFSHIFIDESQDMAGYDFDVIASIFKSSIQLITVGDPRQHTYSSNNLRHNKKNYVGRLDKFIEDQVKKKIVNVHIDATTLSVSHRCTKEICDLASLVYNGLPPTLPCSCEVCQTRKNNYKGGICCVYWVPEDTISSFINEFSPITLVHDKRTRTHPSIKSKINMGESKGIECNSCLIYPTAKMLNFLKKGSELSPTEKARLYVAITRATNVVGIVVADDFKSDFINLPFWRT